MKKKLKKKSATHLKIIVLGLSVIAAVFLIPAVSPYAKTIGSGKVTACKTSKGEGCACGNVGGVSKGCSAGLACISSGAYSGMPTQIIALNANPTKPYNIIASVSIDYTSPFTVKSYLTQINWSIPHRFADSQEDLNFDYIVAQSSNKKLVTYKQSKTTRSDYTTTKFRGTCLPVKY